MQVLARLVAATRPGGWVMIEDTHFGGAMAQVIGCYTLPAEHQAHIFEPYEGASWNHRKGGLGLGLVIVKRIVEAHGGGITIEDNKPQGAVFVVTLAPSAGSAPPPGTH